MTQDEIIRMARDAGFVFPETQEDSFTCWWEELERFAALVAAHEREVCAKVADGEVMNTNMLTSFPPKSSAAWNIAATIRARKDKEKRND